MQIRQFYILCTAYFVHIMYCVINGILNDDDYYDDDDVVVDDGDDDDDDIDDDDNYDLRATISTFS